ncbi:MAG: hypothetical protein H7Y33_12820 [Cytophagales bacterium]|nr:hypothetical protein [Rhizobacter sp.]
MKKRLFAACVFWLASAAWADASLTATETRWLQLSGPAIRYAREQRLPLDIVVQPQPTPGNAPLAMAYVDGRCKLVLSMRGNPEAQSTLDEIPPALLAPVVEAMAAHELGHCWRYVRGAWHTLPAGFASAARESAPASPQLRANMQQTRREEGFADLVGLAWTAAHHPQRYAEVHAWLLKFRDEPEHPGSHHDTVAWLRLAPAPSAFATPANLFDQAWPLWQQGLQQHLSAAD